MKKQIGKNLMQKWKNKIRVRLSALDKKKLVLTNIPYILTAFYTNRASFLYRNSQMQRNSGKESSMVQPDGETLRILNLICRKIPG